ncbi:hypothetical protein F7R23_02000 [Burkholderia diffusa]|nr:hypothetical protein F7R23_02000 [Burkholderia diffusa]
MLRTSRVSIKRVACQPPRNHGTTRHDGPMTHGMNDSAAAACPRGGRATHHAHAIAHRRSAHRARAHRAIRDGMGIAEQVHPHSIPHSS